MGNPPFLVQLCFDLFTLLMPMMDLFGDLPEPSGDSSENTSDLPSSCNNSASHQNADRQSTHCNETHREKRKFMEGTDNLNPCSVKQRRAVRYRLKGYVAERKGEREEMQDAYVLLDNFTDEIPQLDPSIFRLAAYAIFDGHGGARASRFASENLHKNLQDRFPKGDVNLVEKEIKKICIEVFKKTDEDFLKTASQRKPAWKDGTTVTFILIINDTAYVANIGDSEAILCRYKDETKKCIPIPLTTNHNPTVYEERVRIQKVGGTVREGRIMGVLEVSRSLGDGQFKKHGVTCIPDVKKCVLTDSDRFILVACDGLWKSFTPEESIEFVNNMLQVDSTGSGDAVTEDTRYENICTALANESLLRLSADNVTVLLISINPFQPH